MGLMSSIVSRRPPVSGSTSHSKERRWMSMRLGTSRTLDRRAKLRRVRSAARAGTTAAPREVRGGRDERGLSGGRKTRPVNLAQAEADPAEGAVGAHGPRPVPCVCGAGNSSGRLRLSADGGSVAGSARWRHPPAEVGPQRRRAPRRAPFGSCRVRRSLLDLHAPAGLFDLGLELLGLVALDALLDGLGRLVDEGLGLLEAEAGRRADDLDDLDLLVAGGREDDVDGARLLLRRAGVTAAAGGGRGGDRRGGRDAELLLERLDALAQLEHRDALELVDPLLRALGHGVYSVVSGLSGPSAGSSVDTAGWGASA